MFRLNNIIGIDCPAENTRILRVFNCDKYKKLFEDKSLWFSNIDSLIKNCDSLERTVPQGFYARMSISSAKFYKSLNALKDDIYKSYISCWSQKECKELWDAYDPDHEGFAVVSTCGQVLSEIGPDYFLTCKVLYIDHSDKSSGKSLGWVYVDDDQLPEPVSIRIKEQYKDGKYIDDNEIRFIGFDCQNSKGQNIPVNLSKIINGAIINPYASSCVRQALEAFLEERGISLMQSECS
jgi:hypothetical protein